MARQEPEDEDSRTRTTYEDRLSTVSRMRIMLIAGPSLLIGVVAFFGTGITTWANINDDHGVARVAAAVGIGTVSAVMAGFASANALRHMLRSGQ